MTSHKKPSPINHKSIERFENEGGATKAGNLSRKKRPRDANQLAESIVDVATGETDDGEPTPEAQGKDPAAVNLRRSLAPERGPMTDKDEYADHAAQTMAAHIKRLYEHREAVRQSDVNGAALPPTIFPDLSAAADDCSSFLEHYSGSRMPSALQLRMASVLDAIKALANALADRRP